MFNSGFTNKIAYKVIRPYTSQKLHYSSSLEGGASKCYREVKTSMPNSNNFSIMNMTTNEIMDYAMNKLPTQQQNGGIMPTLDMKKLEDRMESLEARIKKIEDQNNGIKIEDQNNGMSEFKADIAKSPLKTDIAKSPFKNEKIIDAGPTHNTSDFAKAFL